VRGGRWRSPVSSCISVAKSRARQKSPLSPLTFHHKNRLSSPSSPWPVRPQTTPPPTLTLPATPRYLPPPPPCPIFVYCYVPTVNKRSFNRYFPPITPSAAPPAFQIHPLDRAILPSSTPAAYRRLSRSVRCCCLSAGRQQWLLTARSLSPIFSAARA